MKKWNEMRWEWNLVLNNEMRMNDMKMKHENDGKKLYNLFTKKIK